MRRLHALLRLGSVALSLALVLSLAGGAATAPFLFGHFAPPPALAAASAAGAGSTASHPVSTAPPQSTPPAPPADASCPGPDGALVLPEAVACPTPLPRSFSLRLMQMQAPTTATVAVLTPPPRDH